MSEVTLTEIELSEKLKEWEEEDMKERKLRDKFADWDYMENASENVRKALELYIETGDLIRAARKYKIPYTELNNYRIKANIPLIV